MTSEGYIESLRSDGVMLMKNDGSHTEIPSDFLKQATELCIENKCSSMIFDLYDPQDKGRTKLTITDCGYAE